ncbi:fimbria/pilus outer membrane usher protein [Proteus hauseri]|uniref:fimbria/pilus outer membrane usher protein n=1 Tax=Proteus hauseri TaxID=183417 RepID=UPI0032DBB82A
MPLQKKSSMNKKKIGFSFITLSLLSLFTCHSVYAEEIPSIYRKSMKKISPEIISELLKNNQPEGIYLTNIYVNNKFIKQKSIHFKNADNRLTPIFSYTDLIELKIDPSFYEITPENKSFPLNKYSIDFDYKLSLKKLHLNIPQKALKKKNKTLADKSLWDDGINAFFSTYNYNTTYNGRSFINQKITFDSGVNLNKWRIRSHYQYSRVNYENNFKLYSLYAYRNLDSFSSIFYSGKFMPSSRTLSSEKIIGFQFISNNLLVGNNLYANKPIIEGIAETEALVTVKQQGKKIYETIVPPGPFVFDSLPTIGSSELIIEIKEADGRVKKIIHYFTSMPNKLNRGNYQYNIISGSIEQKISASNSNNFFFLGEFAYGINQKITSYSAIRKKRNNNTYLTGFIFELGAIGGIASDISYLDGDFSQIKYQLRYSKKLLSTNTQIIFGTSYYQYIEPDNKKNLKNALVKKNTISVFQPIKDFGSLFLNLNYLNHQNNDNRLAFDISFSSSFNQINYSLKYNLKKEYQHNDNHFSVYFSMPIFTKKHAYLWISNSFYYYKNNKEYANSMSIGGSSLENSALNYSINYQSDLNHNLTSANLQYRGDNQIYSIHGYKHSSNNYNLRLGITGAFILHQNAITLSPYLSRTFALVDTQGMSGMKINYSHRKTDKYGYLALQNLMPYHENKIILDAASLPINSESNYYTKTVVPTLGAIAKVTFPVRKGYRVLFQSSSKLPFAATATAFDSQNNLITQSFVSDNNRVFLSGLHKVGLIKIKWGNNKEQQCQFHFDINHDIKDDDLIKKDINCQ